MIFMKKWLVVVCGTPIVKHEVCPINIMLAIAWHNIEETIVIKAAKEWAEDNVDKLKVGRGLK